MFFVKLWRWILGWVSFKAEGGFPERLLNLIYHQGIEIWNVKRKGEHLYVCCHAKDYKKLIIPVRKTGMRIKIVSKHGMPFFTRRYNYRMGLAVGLVAFFMIIQWLSQKCWVVEVSGNKLVDSSVIKTVVSDYGVSIGADLKNLDIETLQVGIMQKLPDLSWAVVNINGCKASIEVNERVNSPTDKNSKRPSNISAKHDGRIISIDVQSGKQLVQNGDAIVEGMILVSGVIDKGAKTELVRSRANILAQTHRKFIINIPLSEVVTKVSEDPILRSYINIFSLKIPTHTSGEIPDEFTKSQTFHMFSLFETDLPIGLENERYDKLVEVVVRRSEKQAAILAEQELAELFENHLSDAKINNTEKSSEIKDGSYILTAKYDCVENIGWESPLISSIE